MDNKGYLDDVTRTGLKLSPTNRPESAVDNGSELPYNTTDNDDVEGEHEKWGNDIEFLLSCIALSVGLGNVWRFPFVALENGGGAFIIPYVIVLVLVGRPFYYMEMIMGQFSSRSNIRIFDFAPVMRGVGYGMVFVTSMTTTYYASLMALTFRYLISSFASELPWSKCREEYGPTCINSDLTGNLTGNEGKKVTSAQFYFSEVILREKTQIDDGIGYPNWDLALCLAFSWFVVAIIMIKGVRSSGKASYFLAIFPYVVLVILLIKALTLPGAFTGVLYFLTPQWNKLLSPQVWYAAVTQCFFSLSICFGSIIIYSSYNKFSHNVKRDSDIVTSLDTFTSLLSGVVIFGILGNLAHETGNEDISKIVQGGTGLAFVSYPDAISKFSVVPQLFSVLFFLMLFVLGIGSEVGLATCVMTCLMDKFPNTKHWIIVTGIAVVGFGIGLVYVTPGGQFILNFVDYYGVTFVVLVVAIAETAAFGWIYGVKRFCNDIQFMSNSETSLYYRLCWGIITPVFMITVLIYTFVGYEPIKYKDYSYTTGMYIFGWFISGLGIVQLVIWGVIGYFEQPAGDERLLRAFLPMADWGPLEKKMLIPYQAMMVENERISLQRKSYWSKFKENIIG
ncbi:sodium-dependent nutrient amino acid transporter 1-like [Eupeodes corollae]|uniref:sodium-dependent nutrient amino acid transporter 1-like n=1 Tax=Eupeodes corollae TaxID=290404 RepID=UPI002491FE85|nr:sodium-dependent nutrient amino acid transporter 1-like [Eupeodes corollae]XP_055906869.1 sodium-dependent nutrient amino acid transporter 1-like [Eupeodes corollae]